MHTTQRMMDTIFILELIRGDVDTQFFLSRLKYNFPVRHIVNYELLALKY